MYKRKHASQWRHFWQLRFRMYSIILIILVTPILYASNSDVNAEISFPPDHFQITQTNLLGSKVGRIGQAQTQPSTSLPDIGYVVIRDGQKIYYDQAGQIITDQLKAAGYDVSYISAEPFNETTVPIAVDEQPDSDKPGNQPPTDTSSSSNRNLDSIIPRPSNPQYTNFLRYPKYNINVPIIYSTFEDLFEKNAEGDIDFSKPRDNGPVDSPIQVKLRDGIVHLAFTPQPGEIGNSYIVGHSSNYSFVKSNYNTVFKPLESRSAPGEEFIIYDRFGRELKFRVFETLKIEEGNVQEAYKNFPDRRVVTLQTSILTWTRNGLRPTHRWLTRGELVI